MQLKTNNRSSNGRKGVTREFAEKYVYSSGLTIYTTQDSNIQNRVEEEFSKPFYQFKGYEKNADGTLKNEHCTSRNGDNRS